MHHSLANTLSCLLLGASILTPAPLIAASGGRISKNPDFTKGEKPPKDAPHTWNLGPTGLRGWIYSDRLETSDARQVYITKVSPNTPASKHFKPGDVILGTAGKAFSYDPRTELGKAITAAEASDGKLTLQRWRAGNVSDVALSLPVLGAYSPTAPYNCKKSKAIFEAGCKTLAEKMQTVKRLNPFERSFNCLALLASGKPEYHPIVKKHVAEAVKYEDPNRRQLHAWYYGPLTIMVAEYTIASGDKSFLPQLKRLTMDIATGQSAVGSWGHKFIQKHNNTLSGYGMMNAPGVPLTTAMVLAKKAGVSAPEIDEAIKKSALLLSFYIGKGSIPYGDHKPWTQTHDDNGKNGAAAILFDLLEHQQGVKYFSRMSVASHGAERETGHTGNYFNIKWALPAVSRSGPNATGAWMKEFGWYYDLARQVNTSYVFPGPPQARVTSYGRWDSTGVFLLSYALPLKKIYLTGKQPSFAPQISPTEAKQLISDGKGWSPKYKAASYKKKTIKELITGLTSWSPVVRERSAIELAKRPDAPVTEVIDLLSSSNFDARIGACQALKLLKTKAAPAFLQLSTFLKSNDLWLRISAAEAIAAMGEAGMPALPELLTMLTKTDPENDPRNMQQRYLTFALFDSRSGLLKNSLKKVDKTLLNKAIIAGLSNQDGRARGSIGNYFSRFTYEELKPLLPAIFEAIKEPAPTGIMFADVVRIKGLQILAKHNIKEGIPWCLKVIELDRWGAKGRVNGCLKALAMYGSHAAGEIPKIKAMERKLIKKKVNVAQIISKIEKNKKTTPLRSLKD